MEREYKKALERILYEAVDIVHAREIAEQILKPKPLTDCDYGTCGHLECHHGGDGR